MFRRYIRLIGPFAMTVFYMSAVLVYVGSGPLWPKFSSKEQNTCTENWWLSLLMLNNYINSLDLCYMLTWYIPCDYQLFLIGLVVCYIYRKNKTAGVLAYLTMAAAAIAIPALVTYYNELPAILKFAVGMTSDVRKLKSFYDLYIRSYNRAGPYVVGLALGYIMSLYKPADYKKKISKIYSVTGVILSLAVMYMLMSYSATYYDKPYDRLEAAIFVGVNRVIWAVAVCTIIACCSYGTVPLVNGFLSWYPFVPLSNLSYGMYLTHVLVIYRNGFSTRAPFRHDFFEMFISTLGAIVFGCFASYLMWLLVEAPLINVTNLIIDPKKGKEIDKNTESKQGNVQIKENGEAKTKTS